MGALSILQYVCRPSLNPHPQNIGFHFVNGVLGFAKWLAMTGLEPAQNATGFEPIMFRSEV